MLSNFRCVVRRSHSEVQLCIVPSRHEPFSGTTPWIAWCDGTGVPRNGCPAANEMGAAHWPWVGGRALSDLPRDDLRLMRRTQEAASRCQLTFALLWHPRVAAEFHARSHPEYHCGHRGGKWRYIGSYPLRNRPTGGSRASRVSEALSNSSDRQRWGRCPVARRQTSPRRCPEGTERQRRCAVILDRAGGKTPAQCATPELLSREDSWRGASPAM